MAYPGERIGLFGGSFDPAHSGHAHVAETARKRLNLSRVWWMVSPQNPLKAKSAPLNERTASAREVSRGRRHVVTTFESELGIGFTEQTVRALKALRPGVHFFWIMGGDGLAIFDRYRRWRTIADTLPLVVVSRPPKGVRVCSAKAGAILGAGRRVPGSLGVQGNRWSYIPAPFKAVSSTELRRCRAMKRAVP
jgi:nicotinate-nucleotide adenylyltransferase